MIIKGFKKTYGNFVLEVDDMSFQTGKIYAIIGPNGSGKSTLAKCIASITNADENKTITYANTAYLPSKGYPFNMSLKENIMLNTKDDNKAKELIDKLDLKQVENQNSKSLSAGQTAKMALARILVNNYDLLILDEPTASMDIKSTILAEDIISSYSNNENVIILITHSIAQAKRLADITIYMEDGKIIEIGETNIVLSKPQNPKTKTFLEFQ